MKILVLVIGIAFFGAVIYKVRLYEKANELGLSYDEYMLFLDIKNLIVKEHFRGREGEINDRHVYKKLIEILDQI